MEYQEYAEDIDFQKYWLILKRHWFLGSVVWCIVVALATLAALSGEPTYEAYGKLRFKKENTTSALATGSGEKFGKLDSVNSKDTPLDTEAEVIRSAPIVNQTIESLKLRDEEGEPVTYDDFNKGLNVETISGTDILSVSYESRQSEEAIEIVNKIMEIYLKNNILTNRSEAVAAREFIDAQLPKVEDSVSKAASALRNFKEQNKIVDLQQEAQSTVAAIDNLNQEIGATRAAIEKNRGLATELRKKIGMSSEEALVRKTLNESVAFQEVFEELKQVEQQLVVERARFQDENPTIINLQEKKAALEALLQQREKQVIGRNLSTPYEDFPESTPGSQAGKLQDTITENLIASEAELQALTNQLVTLIQVRDSYKQRVNDLPKLEQTQRDLVQKLETAQASYKLLLNNREQVQLAENQNVGNAQIASPAIASPYPNSSKKLVLMTGIVVGSLLYVVTTFLLELMDRSIKTTKEVRNIFNYTLLGMIPYPRKKVPFNLMKIEDPAPEHQVRDLPQSTISETYKMLQANLRFLSPDQDLKVIVVTSSVPKEGKSTVSSNLAAAMAQLGRQVLLIDADLHHPQQHHIWQLTNEVGLSEVIVSQATLEKAVTTVMPNLHVLSSGVIPPNSLALLGSNRMNSLIKDFSRTYDFVIIDTSPLLLVADALTLSKISDGILLVSRPGVIDRVSAKATKELLEQSDQNVLGLVANGVLIENEPDSYFHHAKAYSKNEAKSPFASLFKS
ncbi:MAG: polysaccharide biosynthesis tyrosine autokinase [Symploca sp. SIO1C2]|nr:polysaccharide biosynthesis tyrosine autokinase [Symploca sp. SIO1C2]